MFEGKTLTVRALETGFAELCFDNGAKPVNVFDRQTVTELSSALDALAGSQIKGLLVTSAKKVFIAGADISEFGPAFGAGKEQLKGFLSVNNANFNRLENLPFPSVVAINGFALGGGFEFCLACDYRILSSAAQVGFPEVGLGILPGWGGTVRSPRLAGLANALKWVAEGKQHRADDALVDGFVDEVVDPDTLRQAALARLKSAVDSPAAYRSRRQQKAQPLMISADQAAAIESSALEAIRKKLGDHYPAPQVAIKTMVSAVNKPFEEALEAEFDGFYRLSKTPEARALIGNFLSDQKLSSVGRKYASASPGPVRRAAVLGAGTMGGGIAYQNAVRGFAVFMKDINQSALDLGIGEARGLLDKRVQRGALSQEKADSVLAAITPSLSYDGMAECDIVIEAVVEKEAVKKAVLAEVEREVPESTILASNTSSILISSIAEALERPENFCGLHFFNPVHAMPLVEVVRGQKTSDVTVARAVEHVLGMGKKPVVVNDCPGFLVNRVLFPYFAGFNLLMRDGADFKDLDRVMEGWGWPMGPAYLLDVIGIDVAVHAADVMADGFPDRLKLDFPQATHLMAEHKRLGQKNGKGFYLYESGAKGKLAKQNDPETWSILSSHVAERQRFGEDDIVARMMVPMCIEMARCLEEGITGSPAEADMALLYGLGFPRFRGGVFRWLEEIGMAQFCAMADRFSHLGKLYEPTEAMRGMAADNRRYYSQ